MMFTVFLIYLALVFFIGLAAERFISKSEEGYYLGDRNFGPLATAISAGASDTSGWIFIGAVGYAYVAGISTMWMLPGFVAGYLLNWFVVAPRFRRSGEELGALSLPDYFGKRFRDPKNLLKISAGIIIAFFFIAYMASQLTAAGKALSAIVSYDYTWGLILSAAFVTGYSIFGGYRAAVWTEVSQGLIMLGVLILFPLYMILFPLGGFGEFFNTLQSIDPILLSANGGTGGAIGFGVILGLIGFGLGEPGQPHIIQRFLSAKDDQTIRQGSVIAMIWVIVVMTGSNLLGLIGRIMVPDIDDPEYVFPQLTMDIMHPAIAGIIVGAIFAAIQSTFSSQLMVATQTIASDLLKSLSKKTFTPKQMVTISRVTMILLGILSTGLALLNVQAVFNLVLYAWAGLAASFGPLLIISLYTKWVTRQGAFWGMITGAVVTITWINSPLVTYVYEIIPAMLASTTVIYLVSKATAKKEAPFLNSEEEQKTTNTI
ncbi:sodium/proline symporter [Metabacillus dongyingensis]|uniref:sodium/proline symporter n=1 Tax=Metabacillus dongyingensis TaxID=2874282 RepID=UPI003B8E807E